MSSSINIHKNKRLSSSLRPHRRILVVTGDLPSHPYAAAKLAKVLANAGHSVTLASPEGPAYDRIVSETKHYPSRNNKNSIECITVGTVTPTTKHFNERPVVNPHSWTAMFEALWNPFPVAQMCVQDLFDRQEDMYEPIKYQLEHGNYDLVIPIHATAITVCDAAEALALSSNVDVPVVIYSSLPYDPAFYLGERAAWYVPRSLTTFPHVATYSAIDHHHNTNILQRLLQAMWQLLDAYLTARAWSASATYNNDRRAQRGLPPLHDGWRGYLQTYPVLSLGGVPPFFVDDDTSSSSHVAPNVTVVGTLNNMKDNSDDEDPTTVIAGDLKEWLDRSIRNYSSGSINNISNNRIDDEDKANGGGIIYVGFGTGTVLTDQEAANITGGLLQHRYRRHCGAAWSQSTSAAARPLPPILFALRPSEQARLRPIMDAAIGSPPTSMSDTHLEYMDGRLRIQANVPQTALLQSGLVRLFVSHMGMGGMTEGVQGGVPFVCYPSGCDQYFNAQRAVDAGIAVLAPVGLEGIGTVVQEALDNETLAGLAQSSSKALQEVHGEERALDLVDSVTARAIFVREPSAKSLLQTLPRMERLSKEEEEEMKQECSNSKRNEHHVSFRPNVSLIVDKQQQQQLRRSSTAEAA